MTHRELLEYSQLGRKIDELKLLCEEEGRKISDPRSSDFSGVARGTGSPDAYHDALDIRSTLMADIEDLTVRRKQLYRKLSQVMDILPDDQHQKAFVQLYLKGYDVRETSKILHFSHQHVYKLRRDICIYAEGIA